MKKTIIINLLGSPGSGKSTLASLVFAKLKMLGINCELVNEFAKDKVWEKNNEALLNQIYIFAKQYYRITRCAEQVDVIVTDSPLLLSAFYNKDFDIDKPLKELVFTIFNKYDNINYFLKRVKSYNPIGRLQTEKESDEYAIRIKEMLKANRISFKEIDGDIMSADIILQDLMKKLKIIKKK